MVEKPHASRLHSTFRRTGLFSVSVLPAYSACRGRTQTQAIARVPLGQYDAGQCQEQSERRISSFAFGKYDYWYLARTPIALTDAFISKPCPNGCGSPLSL
ncbi:MAG: hypothetical protein HOP36_08275 [Methyloglobulus sp.]|nr:hypothetical protein [Methyloglobulus sp.]